MQHWTYINDIIVSYDYYFDAVEPIEWNGYQLVDYSLPRYHNVVGFDLMPILFSSFSEPLSSTLQYLDFANLKPGNTVFDLGAYSGLSSILFKQNVGAGGRVIAVDADTQNIASTRRNFSLYKKITQHDIDLIHGAMWHHCDGLEFTEDGTMGASAAEIIGTARGKTISVPSYTLSKLAETFQTNAVDFIKCDIEGAEAFVFLDERFFENNHPKIVIEAHPLQGQLTTETCIHTLKKYGYTCEIIEQPGVPFPLIQCTP